MRDLAKKREYNREWYRNQPPEFRDRERLRLAEFRKNNREKLRQYYRDYFKRYYAANPHKRRQHNATAKARRKGCTLANLSADEWTLILEMHAYCCAYCGFYFNNLEQDHVIPLSKGGVHTFSNVVPACKSCNSSKGNRLLDSDKTGPKVLTWGQAK